MMQPPALISGACGWLGARLVLAIAKGLPEVPALKDASPDRLIRCLIHRNGDASVLKNIPGRIELVEGDIGDPASLAEFFKDVPGGIVFNCAGIIHPASNVKEFYAVNTVGTKNLIEAAKDARIKRFIHVSSNSPFGFNPNPQSPFDESSPYNPYMNYGKSKKLAEEIVNGAAKSGKIETVIVRPPWFYGPGQPPRQTRFFSMIKKGRAPIVGNGENLRSMVYVDNLCQGLLLCERVQKAHGRTYWIADKNPYAMNRIVDSVGRAMEDDFKIEVSRGRVKLPGIVSEIARLMDSIFQSVGWYQQEIHVLSEMNKNIVCSISKARKELGYDPKIDLDEGMRRSLKWMIDNQIAI